VGFIDLSHICCQTTNWWTSKCHVIRSSHFSLLCVFEAWDFLKLSPSFRSIQKLTFGCKIMCSFLLGSPVTNIITPAGNAKAKESFFLRPLTTWSRLIVVRSNICWIYIQIWRVWQNAALWRTDFLMSFRINAGHLGFQSDYYGHQCYLFPLSWLF
jgi:hypothetical protein